LVPLSNCRRRERGTGGDARWVSDRCGLHDTVWGVISCDADRFFSSWRPGRSGAAPASRSGPTESGRFRRRERSRRGHMEFYAPAKKQAGVVHSHWSFALFTAGVRF